LRQPLPLHTQVLADFRAGKFNTLVATCIGEEGLDIPQVPQN
jgi:ERCC4-related helicase